MLSYSFPHYFPSDLRVVEQDSLNITLYDLVELNISLRLGGTVSSTPNKDIGLTKLRTIPNGSKWVTVVPNESDCSSLNQVNGIGEGIIFINQVQVLEVDFLKFLQDLPDALLVVQILQKVKRVDQFSKLKVEHVLFQGCRQLVNHFLDVQLLLHLLKITLQESDQFLMQIGIQALFLGK